MESPGTSVGRGCKLRAATGVCVRITTGGVTDMGRVRTNNEDCYKIVEPLHLFVLSDGMGGEAHGEIASAMAVETVVKHCLDVQAKSPARVDSAGQRQWAA